MKVAIIGYGKMGKFYDNLLQAAYIVDMTPVANRASFTSVDEFIFYKQPVDLVIVATPSHTHGEIVKKLLYGHYNVLCEKPLTLSSEECINLEALAKKHSLILYQSTLERYNPLVKFLKHNIPLEDIASIESYRFGHKPASYFSSNAMFDLGIHDVDLWFHLAKGKVPWRIHAAYKQMPKRKLSITLRNNKRLELDLLHRQITLQNGSTLDFNKSSANNPMLEMIYDLSFHKNNMNEQWHKEIALIEQNQEMPLDLGQAVLS